MTVNADDFDKLWRTVFGNGDVGMDEVLRANTKAIARLDAKVDGVKQSVDDLRQERRDDRQKVEGRRELFNWIKFALGLLALAAPLFFGYQQVKSQNQLVIEQLRNLPPLPE